MFAIQRNAHPRQVQRPEPGVCAHHMVGGNGAGRVPAATESQAVDLGSGPGPAGLVICAKTGRSQVSGGVR